MAMERPVRRPRERWISLPFWIKLIVVAVLWLPWALALPVSMFGSTRHSGGSVGGLSGFIGASVGSWFREHDYWSLSAADRVAVSRIIRSGTPSGSDELNSIAAGRFQRSQVSHRATLILAVILCLVLVGVPVVAAARDDVLWLLALLPVSVLVWANLAVRPKRRSWKTFQRLMTSRNHTN
jgi:4-amino-4-deoxy-L-arabinose transferase-like glycosyltransferase